MDPGWKPHRRVDAMSSSRGPRSRSRQRDEHARHVLHVSAVSAALSTSLTDLPATRPRPRGAHHGWQPPRGRGTPRSPPGLSGRRRTPRGFRAHAADQSSPSAPHEATPASDAVGGTRSGACRAGERMWTATRLTRADERTDLSARAPPARRSPRHRPRPGCATNRRSRGARRDQAQPALGGWRPRRISRRRRRRPAVKRRPRPSSGPADTTSAPVRRGPGPSACALGSRRLMVPSRPST